MNLNLTPARSPWDTLWDPLRRWLGLAPAEEPAIAMLEPVPEDNFQGDLAAVFGQIDTMRKNGLVLAPRTAKAGMAPGHVLAGAVALFVQSSVAGLISTTHMEPPTRHDEYTKQATTLTGKSVSFRVYTHNGGIGMFADGSALGGSHHKLDIQRRGTQVTDWFVTVWRDADNVAPLNETLTTPPVRPSADPLDAERAITLWLFRQPAFQEALIAMVQWGRAVQALETGEAARAAKEVV